MVFVDGDNVFFSETGLEMDAFNTETGEDPLPNDPLYMLYKKFGWMWGYFYSAEWIED